MPLEQAKSLPQLSEKERKKIELTAEVMDFAKNDLGLNTKNNYTTYSQLDGPYVTYAVSAAKAYRLEPHLWYFPIVGDVPYKGFFVEADAKSESENLKNSGLDTYVRGVSAYSTLGWFKDPLLSSMLKYDEPDLVNTLIHETIHANLFIKSSADFNERLATFLGNIGTEMFYEKKLGSGNAIFISIQEEQKDSKIFSTFITQEIKDLKAWYLGAPLDPELKSKRLKEIQARFLKDVKPQLKTKSFSNFADQELNNAKILAYGTYLADLEDFQNAFNKMGRDFFKFMEFCKSLANSKHPEEDVKKVL